MIARLVKELEVALGAATGAAERIAPFRRSPLEIETKTDDSPVTGADKAADEFIREQLLRHFPEDSMLTEEAGESGGDGERRWVVDPIDGTKAFTRGLPHWSILIGLEVDGEPVLGVAMFPEMQLTYHAVRGSGAFRNGRRIEQQETPAWERAIVMAGEIGSIEEASGRTIRQIVDGCWSLRSYGDAMGACLVADGRADVWIEAGVKRWDLAALAPILRETGARFTSFDGSSNLESGNVIAARTQLHQLLIERLGNQGVPPLLHEPGTEK